MKDRDRFIKRILDGWQVRAEAARNPSLETLRGRGRCCASCEAGLPMPWSAGFRQCPTCRPGDAHALYTVFRYRGGCWHCRFFDGGPNGVLVKEVGFTDADKVRETARRGKALTFAMGKLSLNHALSEHRDATLWLQLDCRQYLDLQGYTRRDRSPSF